MFGYNLETKKEIETMETKKKHVSLGRFSVVKASRIQTEFSVKDHFLSLAEG
jgi:hypothetical protein